MHSANQHGGQMMGLGLGDQVGLVSGQVGANAGGVLQGAGGSLGGLSGVSVSSPSSFTRGSAQAYAALQGAGSPGGSLSHVHGLRLATAGNAGTSNSLGSMDSPLGMGMGSSLQGGLTASNLIQMQQLQMQGGLGGSLGSIQMGVGSDPGSHGPSPMKGDQGTQISALPGLSGLHMGAGNGGDLGGLSGIGMGNLFAQQQGSLQMIQANAVNAALAQQQQQQQQLAVAQQQAAARQVVARQLAAQQQAAGLGPGRGNMALMPGQMGIVQSDTAVGLSKEDLLLPPDAAPTLYVDGIPSDITRREFAHVFRPFDGYKGSRVVMKERETGKSMQVYGFVDFNTPQEAAYAKQQLQGYPMDLEEETTNCLNISYARPLRNPNVVGRRGHKARNKT